MYLATYLSVVVLVNILVHGAVMEGHMEEGIEKVIDNEEAHEPQRRLHEAEVFHRP